MTQPHLLSDDWAGEDVRLVFGPTRMPSPHFSVEELSSRQEHASRQAARSAREGASATIAAVPSSALDSVVPQARPESGMSSDRFHTLFGQALQLGRSVNADALMLLAEANLDWADLKKLAGEYRLVVVGESHKQVDEASKAGLPAVLLALPDRPVHERLSQAMLECVADDILKPGARVVAMYSGFEADVIDSMSLINLGEHLDRLTGRDLRKLEVNVPLETLRVVVDLALDIGREGREGKPVGTMFVLGDHRKVLEASGPIGFDPVKGYSRRERNLHDRRVREGIKEIAQLDGAFVIASDGTVVAACRRLTPKTSNKTPPVALSKGLGTRHWAAAEITTVTNAVAIAVSETSGTVRIFHNGEIVLRIEPFRRPMKWKDFGYPQGGPMPE
ncbi:MAG TPA: diadenylate cyclase [Pirellulales bacterium]